MTINVRFPGVSCRSTMRKTAEKEEKSSTVYTVLRRVNLLAKIFLVSPYTIKDDCSVVLNRTLSWVQFASLMLTVLLEIRFQTESSDLVYHGNPYKLLASMRALASVLLSMLTSIEMKFNHRKIERIFDEIGDLNRTIQFNRSQLREYAKTVTWFATLFLTAMSISLLSVARRKDAPMWNKLLLTFHVMRLVSLPIVMQIQFVALAALIARYIEWTKETLRSRLPQAKKQYPISNELFILTKSTGEITPKWTARRVQEIRCCYGRINDLKVLINEAFSFRLWLLTINTFIELVFYIFLSVMVLQFWNSYGSGVYSPPLILHSAWTLLIACLFFQMVSLCETISSSGKEIGVLVHQLFTDAHSPTIREELSAFSMELLHRNTSITAYKFFNIDYPLVSSVLASSLTYIIILLQFQFPDYDDGLRPIQDLLSRS
ncbi:UNVERIFIED_CONTAM: hypothetical protein PYX00_005894 [Menopon gallinae]|uniref:Gustatory receptor n=1 Tax=Menopon gallinae TaxID=328185 RepID=A0AAW2HTE8_9NEOP